MTRHSSFNEKKVCKDISNYHRVTGFWKWQDMTIKRLTHIPTPKELQLFNAISKKDWFRFFDWTVQDLKNFDAFSLHWIQAFFNTESTKRWIHDFLCFHELPHNFSFLTDIQPLLLSLEAISLCSHLHKLPDLSRKWQHCKVNKSGQKSLSVFNFQSFPKMDILS